MRHNKLKKSNNNNNISIQDSNLSKESKVPTIFDAHITNISYTKIITDKINFLITTLENENDILIQNTTLDLISKYLEVLDKLKIINSNNNSSSSSRSRSKET